MQIHLKTSSQLRMLLTCFLLAISVCSSFAQTGPSRSEASSYKGLHLAAYVGDMTQLKALISEGASLEEADKSGRTALHIAAYESHEEVVVELAKAGANMNALEHQAYDIVTIAAVANDFEMLDTALNQGASAGNVTSPYDGTALIAAAHLGHHQVVKRLIDAGAPLNHVNNLRWTALIEAVVLGDGGPDHIQTVKHLVKAGADKNITDRDGQTPLNLARSYGFEKILAFLEQ